MVAYSNQYYQYLYALNCVEAIQLPNGSWSDLSATWSYKAACREETNGKGSTIQTADGQSLIFTSLIQLPKGTERLSEGVEVIVTREEVTSTQLLNDSFISSAVGSGLIVARGICKKFDIGRLHCRLWI